MFANRKEAGLLLVNQLQRYKKPGTVIAGIPRGGVVTAAAVAHMLHLPLTLVITKKIPAPDQPELAIGAVGPSRTVYYNDEVVQNLGLSKKQLAKQQVIAEQELHSYQARFPIPRIVLKGRTVILMDDGIATGATVRVAIDYLRKRSVAKLVLAAPVAHPNVVEELLDLVDEYVILEEPLSFQAVGQYYEEFEEVGDEEVRELLKKSKKH